MYGKTHECCTALSLRRVWDDLHVSLHKGFKIRLAGIRSSLFGVHWEALSYVGFSPLAQFLLSRKHERPCRETETT